MTAPVPSPIAMPPPTSRLPVAADTTLSGPPIPAIDRIRLFSDDQWEAFVLEWADSLRDKYERVERCGGAGDMGRDVIAFLKNGGGAWDNYQCKRYRQPLAPSDIWIELGKLAFYTKRGDYTCPKRYSFVAPQGAGTKLSNLFKKPDALRAGLFDAWEAHCCRAITRTGLVDLDDAMKAHINGLDFSIFDAVPPLRLLDEHAKTRWHVARFGGGLPPRPPVDLPPPDPADTETVFVRELFAAYAEYTQKAISSLDDLMLPGDLLGHFQDSRVEFYSAESLRTFSRDTLPPGEFEKLQDDLHAGIRDEVRAEQPDGYRRVLSVVRTARQLALAAHALHIRMSVRDRGGICHQLANDGKVKWVR